MKKKMYKVTVTREIARDEDMIDTQVFTDNVSDVIKIIGTYIDGFLRETNGLYINDRVINPVMLRYTKFDADENTIAGIKPYDY